MSMFMNSCRKLTVSSAHLLRPSSVASQNFARYNLSYESKKFPGYFVIYKLDQVQNLGIVNRLKRDMSVVAVVFPITSYGLEYFSILPDVFAFYGTTTALSVCGFLQAIGFFCNNVVGFIYKKKDTENLVISYLNFWGKRVDITVNFTDIECYEPPKNSIFPFFNTMSIPSKKLKLKLPVQGKIMDENEYHKLFDF